MQAGSTVGEVEGGQGQNSCIYPQYCGCQNSCIYSQLSGCRPHQHLSAWEQTPSFYLFNNCAWSPTELVLLLINQWKQMSLHLADVCFSLLHCPVLLCHTSKASVSMEWKNHRRGCQFPRSWNQTELMSGSSNPIGRLQKGAPSITVHCCVLRTGISMDFKFSLFSPQSSSPPFVQHNKAVNSVFSLPNPPLLRF